MDAKYETEGRGLNRRQFLAGASALGASFLLSLTPKASAEPPPETTTLRILEGPVTCIAPSYVTELLLRAEGFTDVHYVKTPSETKNWSPTTLLTGEVDISASFLPSALVPIDAGKPLVILAGHHLGCVELFATNRVRSTVELKGKTVKVTQFNGDEHIFISMFVAYVGLDPHKDINWVLHPFAEGVRLFTEGKIDAFMSGPPLSQELRARKVGHVLVNNATDKPWSDYFCCVIASTPDFVRQHPVATKRALRAFLKGADVCATEPTRVARLIADKGYASYEYALQMLQELPYGRWREYEVEDAVRFYALRMQEVGIIKNNPQKIIAQGTDWRFLNELKKELKV